MTRHSPIAGPDAAGIRFSFELFPPRTPEGLAQLDRVVDRLAALGPEGFSVTHGAGGTTRDRTRGVVERVAARTGLPVAQHLTCIGARRAEIDDEARALRAAGIRRIVALRGDPPAGGAPHPPGGGYRHAADLVAGLMRIADFDISVAAYPEVHPEAASAAADLDNLRRKFDAGARRAITQYCFDTDTVLRFVDRARAAGIDRPIVPGIMPVSHFGRLRRFSETCGAAIPRWLAGMFEGLDADPARRAGLAAAVATEQCRRLAAAGLTDFHIYSLNRAEVSVALCRALRPERTGAGPQAA
ncbi:methylenetetrahydrofolate reductase [Paralimibaculum aggregatum]|uniref:Methylenetetrahydrofolate reductase n=1 Tax=Paralimibaculum aggregatum TaxID=3036245 RepID=A0ABQ6LDR3_9RHOB|nr:methylenetetrahydrofolate reductase [NAD(P)H] [Limibaculum sp. NKW23]GMG81499.1 methylenetetrahydrofolate reductase [Limibaculum sp. NKW23]